MSSQFDFFQHWYPVSPLEDLDPTRPTSVTLLGRRLVIWKPKSSSTYRVFLDECPHRLAPLSEGLLDDKTGNLMCSYHGWQFDPSGNCTHIPQGEKPELITKNKQLCTVALPCREEQDLLWVWPDEKTAKLSETVPLPLSPQIDTDKGFVWSSYVRDLEYDWQTLVENLVDPSHVPFAHHGIQGNREKAQPIPIEILQSTPDLIEAKTKSFFPTKITFEPPCHLEYAINFGQEGRQIGLITYCIPVSPGKSRFVAHYNFTRNVAKSLSKFTPRWWDHITERNLLLDGDMILLHQQEFFLQQRQESWKTAYKLPTTADRLVIEFRRWFDKYCEGKLPWDEVGLKVSDSVQICQDRKVMLDRDRQHTQHCASCRKALQNIQIIQKVLLGYFAVIVAVVAVMPDIIRIKFGIPLIGVALVGLGVYSWLKLWLEPKFYFVDYIHSER